MEDSLVEIQALKKRVENFVGVPDADDWRMTWEFLGNDIEVFASKTFVEGSKDYVTLHNAVSPFMVPSMDDWQEFVEDYVTSVHEALRLVEHRLGRGHSDIIQNPSTEVVIPAGTPHSAYVLLRDLVQQAKHRVWIVDPGIDRTIFDLLSNANVVVTMRLLTRKSNLPRDFASELALYMRQTGRQCEAKDGLTDQHDRYLIVDDRTFSTGGSLKDLGRKESVVTELRDVSSAIIAGFEGRWTTGAPI